jgi:peptide/nickel transport system substrate-binding protein
MSELKKLESLLIDKKMSRRDFVARLSALGLTAAISPALFTRTASAEMPKKGGTLRMGFRGGMTTDSMDPGTLNDTVDISINWSTRNGLVEVDHQGEVIPELAEMWEASPDAKNWTFKLRKGVEFHNGKTMTAKDVAYSINYHRGEDSKSAAKSVVNQIDDIKIQDDHTITFMLSSGDADYPYKMSDYHLVIFPDGTTKDEVGKCIGTGGYILENHEPGVSASLKRNPNYWKNGRAHFDALEYICINDTNARTSALQSDRVDVINGVDLKTAHLLKRNPNLNIVDAPGNRHFAFPMRCDLAPYSDNNVRLALKHAVNRQEVLDKILRGYGYLGNDLPIGKNQKYFAKDLPQRQYDPEKAKFYMKKAGMLDHTFNIHTADGAFQGAVDACVLYKEQAAKAGIKINVVKEPSDGYFSNIWMKKEWVASYWSGRATADWMLSIAYSDETSWNESFWKNKRFNSLLKEARSELNETKRAEMYFEIQKILYDDGGSIIPMFANWVMGANKRLNFDNVAGDWDFDGLRGTERWWFA